MASIKQDRTDLRALKQRTLAAVERALAAYRNYLLPHTDHPDPYLCGLVFDAVNKLRAVMMAGPRERLQFFGPPMFATEPLGSLGEAAREVYRLLKIEEEILPPDLKSHHIRDCFGDLEFWAQRLKDEVVNSPAPPGRPAKYTEPVRNFIQTQKVKGKKNSAILEAAKRRFGRRRRKPLARSGPFSTRRIAKARCRFCYPDSLSQHI